MIIPVSGSPEGFPFGRVFFSVYLEDLYKRGDAGSLSKLTLYLVDGTSLDVCQIEELADNYMVIRAYDENEPLCELSLNVIPYGIVYRIELGRRAGGDVRVGFKWKQPAAMPIAAQK